MICKNPVAKIDFNRDGVENAKQRAFFNICAACERDAAFRLDGSLIRHYSTAKATLAKRRAAVA